MTKGQVPAEQFEVFRKNFLSMQKKYEEKIKELSIIREMNKTMQQVDLIDQDMIWIHHLECLKKYKGLAGAALYFTLDNEIKRDFFFYTDFEETVDLAQFRKVSFFQELLCQKKVVVNPLSDTAYTFYGQSIVSGGKVIAVLMLFAREKNAFDPSHLTFYNVVCEHFYNSMVFLRLYYGKLNEEKQMIQMSRFFSKNIIGEVIKKGKLKLGGQKRSAAVIFIDLKGFTTFSESMEPEDVIILLNRFFSCMIPVIFKNGGTLDKLLGDGIMAVFGAPLEDPNACLHAVQTSLEMFITLKKLNRDFADEGISLDMSVGINFGKLVAGLMGSHEHMNYTVVGDTVNAAQRIQSLAESNQILVSEAVWNKIQPYIDTIEEIKEVTRLDNVKLKGKEKEVTLFQLEPNV